MAQWRVLIPIGIAIALWALGIVRLDVPGDITLPVAASGPCRPTAADVAATDVARAAFPTTTPTPAISDPIVTTELVVLARDRDVPQLIPSLIIRAPARDQPAINKLLSTNLDEIEGDDSETPVPFTQREEKNAYRALLAQLLTNEFVAEEEDDIGLLSPSASTTLGLLGNALGISEPPIVGVSGNGTITLVIPQTPRLLADNHEAIAGGWTVTSSGRDVTLQFDGRPEARTTWDVRVCTDGLPIVSTSLLTPTPPPRAPTPRPTRPSPTPTSSTTLMTSLVSQNAGSAHWLSWPVAPESSLVFQNPNSVQWSFPAGIDPTEVKITTQAPVLSAFRMFLFTDWRQNIATALALLVPAGLLLAGVWLVFQTEALSVEAEGARERLALTSTAILRLTIAAALYPFLGAIAVRAQKFDSMLSRNMLSADFVQTLVPGFRLPAGLLLTFPILILTAVVSLGLIDYPMPRFSGFHRWPEVIALGLIVLVAAGWSFAYLATVQPVRTQYTLINPALLIAAYMMFLVTAIRLWLQPGPTVRRWSALTLPVVGALSFLLCTLRWEIEQRLTESRFVAGSLLSVWVTACVVAGFVLLTIALLRGIPIRENLARLEPASVQCSGTRDQRNSVLLGITVAVALVILVALILIQWGWSIYSQETIWWRSIVEANPLSSLVGIANATVAAQLVNYPITFLVSVVELLFVLGLLGLIAVLYAAGNPRAEPFPADRTDQTGREVSPQTLAALAKDVDLRQEPFWKSHQDWVKWMLAGLFAAFVIGYGGQVLGLRAPVAFVLGLILLKLTLSNRIEEVANRIDKENPRSNTGEPLIVSRRGDLIQRELALANLEQQLAMAHGKFKSGDVPAAVYYATRDSLANQAKSIQMGLAPAETKEPPLMLAEGDVPGELALTMGPKKNWWENGRLATSLGSRLAIVPIAYFVYVFLSSHGVGGWSISSPFAITGLITALAYEVAFWLVAAFAFGCLFPYLPGRNGPVKGAVLAAVYVGANAGAALLGITGNALWQVRSFQLLLFLMLLGAWMDLKSVEAEGLRRRDLVALYDLPNTSNLISQVLPLVTALSVVVAQLLLGQTQAATENLISGDAATQILFALQQIR